MLHFVLVPRTLHAASGDTSVATLHLSGVVPTYFHVTAYALTDGMDLTPKVIVNNRAIGLLHFKYNQNVGSITVSSSTVSGAPEDAANNAYAFGGGTGFRVSFSAGCVSVDAAYNTPFLLTQAGTAVQSVASGTLTTSGIEEDCTLFATYQGTTANLPMGGLYTMDLYITMIAL